MTDQAPDPSGVDGFGLLMPFVVCTSQGGPHADEPFVAGYECGAIDTMLELATPPTMERYVRSTNVPQLDLIAMRHGYSMKSKPWEDDESWTHMILRKMAVTP